MTAAPPPAVRGFAVPARLHAFLLFMTQFVVLIGAFGGVVPVLYRQGVHPAVLGLGGAAGLVVFHLGLGALARVLPVRRAQCQATARFTGFGWWPFIYRYRCGACGTLTRLEISG